MSKHRPSAPRPRALAHWRRRVFHNSFTRHGRRHRVSRWAFKVQFQGRRRTFSLPASNRTEAAQAARHLHDVLLSQGWEAAIRLHESQGRPRPSLALPQTDLRLAAQLAQWEQRLIQRRYHEARLRPGPEFSVRIEHDGAFAFFPLGSFEPKRAARQAWSIHRTILTRGWQTAFERFTREITLAVFWSDNPEAVTYTTLYTFVAGPPPSPAPTPADGPGPKHLAALEPDPTVLESVRFWLDRQPGFCCRTIGRTGLELLAALDWERTAMVLVNRAAPDLAPVLHALKTRRPGLPVFPYQIHEESDQIFISISGVSGGYLLKRRLPSALFEPLQAAVQAGTLSLAAVRRHIRDYFQAFFDHAAPPGDLPRTGTLTPREQEILNHISKGYLDKEIAHHLNLSIWTVHNHVKHIYEKLNVHNRTEAVLKHLQA